MAFDNFQLFNDGTANVYLSTGNRNDRALQVLWMACHQMGGDKRQRNEMAADFWRAFEALREITTTCFVRVTMNTAGDSIRTLTLWGDNLHEVDYHGSRWELENAYYFLSHYVHPPHPPISPRAVVNVGHMLEGLFANLRYGGAPRDTEEAHKRLMDTLAELVPHAETHPFKVEFKADRNPFLITEGNEDDGTAYTMHLSAGDMSVPADYVYPVSAAKRMARMVCSAARQANLPITVRLETLP